MNNQYNNFNKNFLEAILYPAFLLIIMWGVFYIDFSLDAKLYKFGVLPQTTEGLKGIFFMPFIHSQSDINHILSNSLPTAILFALLIYFYKPVALRVSMVIWFSTGFLVWYIAQATPSYHIGMSGIIYGLFGFLFFSGIFRKHTPLWGISLFVIFLYGSLIWGIFPTEKGISWEGHLFGLLSGLVCAIAFRKEGPQAVKFQYEIEQEMGIEPPDLEGIYNEKLRLAQERYLLQQQEIERLKNERLGIVPLDENTSFSDDEKDREKSKIKIIYMYTPNPKSEDNID